MDFKFDFGLCDLILTYNTLHHPTHIRRMLISGIYNCWIYNGNMQSYRNTQPGGIPCTNAFNSHTI